MSDAGRGTKRGPIVSCHLVVYGEGRIRLCHLWGMDLTKWALPWLLFIVLNPHTQSFSQVSLGPMTNPSVKVGGSLCNLRRVWQLEREVRKKMLALIYVSDFRFFFRILSLKIWHGTVWLKSYSREIFSLSFHSKQMLEYEEYICESLNWITARSVDRINWMMVGVCSPSNGDKRGIFTCSILTSNEWDIQV